MPRGQPFTRMCEQVAAVGRPADLHVHTTASDGDLTPSQVVALARQAGLAAIAVTDHDTTAGVAEAVATARQFPGRPLAVVPGVEVSTEHEGREYHVLGYFVRPEDPALAAALGDVRARRAERFGEYLSLLAAAGVAIPRHLTAAVRAVSASLGRRHLADLLTRAGVAGSRSVAFREFLEPLRDRVTVNHRLDFAAAVRLIGEAGGVASLAHPPADLTEPALAAFAGLGLRGVEMYFPAATSPRSEELRGWAGKLGLLVTGGSDFHGPDAPRRLGTPALPSADYRRLSDCAGRTASAAAAGSPG